MGLTSDVSWECNGGYLSLSGSGFTGMSLPHNIGRGQPQSYAVGNTDCITGIHGNHKPVHGALLATKTQFPYHLPA